MLIDKITYIWENLKNNTMANYNVTVECTYTFDVEIMKASSKAEAMRLATTMAAGLKIFLQFGF